MTQAKCMAGDRATVLMYHRIGEFHNEWERKYAVTPRRFADHMHALARTGMRAVTIDDFVAWIEGRSQLPEGAFLLTFDDGFLGIRDHAAAVLRELAWPATVFLVADLIGGTDEWCRAENPSAATYPLLGRDDVLALAAQGFSFHSHSRSHHRLTLLDDARLKDELFGAKAVLEALLSRPVDYLAYPYGVVDGRVIAAARESGYRAGFSVRPGFNRPNQVDPFLLHRLDVWGFDTPTMLLRKIRLGSNLGSLGSAWHYYAGRALARLGMSWRT